MKNTIGVVVVILVILVGVVYFLNADRTPAPSIDSPTDTSGVAEMTFFVTSRNPGTGANFGGLTAADQFCQALADEAGAGDKTWRAYLSAAATGGAGVVNARDRIGDGPWHNYNGELIASSVESLHSDSNQISKETGLTENGDEVNGRGDSPNVHDILTGSLPDGTASDTDEDTTCSNWTSESADGSAIVGHHDRVGLDESDEAKSWNSSHGSRGCSLPNLNSTGGGGLLYCFAL